MAQGVYTSSASKRSLNVMMRESLTPVSVVASAEFMISHSRMEVSLSVPWISETWMDFGLRSREREKPPRPRPRGGAREA